MGHTIHGVQYTLLFPEDRLQVPTLDDTIFHSLVDDIFMEIEDLVDELDDDVDIDSTGGVLTFTFQGGSNVILSRQIGNHEVWVAARSGGFHLRFENNSWVCPASGENLQTLVNRVFVEQGSSPVFS